MMTDQASLKLLSGSLEPDQAPSAFQLIRFQQPQHALNRFAGLCQTADEQVEFVKILPAFLYHLQDCASPDQSFLTFERYLHSVPSRFGFLKNLVEQPRALEILMRLFVGSQYLSEILLRNPHYLDDLTNRHNLVEFKSRNDFVEAGLKASTECESLAQIGGCLRQFQQWELLRIAACDTFGLLDLKTVTLQLSLLADAIVQLCILKLGEIEQLDISRFSVLAFGKLGGEELNYSSDIDLIFLCEQHAERYWGFAQKLIKLISEPTDDGFLYRVDMRLRPWGSAGSLVTTGKAYLDYIEKQGQLWEKQALIKARPIAGDLELGRETLRLLSSKIYAIDANDARQNILEMKQRIEQKHFRSSPVATDVKTGPGGIRDIEFVTQYLQLINAGENPFLRTANTTLALNRLTETGILNPPEFRKLSSAYSLLRTIEHALQLMHNQSIQKLPASERELSILANRLDFPDTETFHLQYAQHTQEVRAIFDSYIRPAPTSKQDELDLTSERPLELTSNAYFQTFSQQDLKLHADLLKELSDQQIVKLHVQPAADKLLLTIVGNDQLGDLSAICGLLYAHGFNISDGYAFTGDKGPHFPQQNSSSSASKKYINALTITRAGIDTKANSLDLLDLENELNELLMLSKDAQYRHAQGRLADRVVNSLPEATKDFKVLLPVEIEVLPSPSDSTLLRIRGEDTPGFLYELTNAITMSGLSIVQMTIQSFGSQVIDTLHVVDQHDRQPAPEKIQELRAAIVLIKHFTHFLPHSPNPEKALEHFREFLDNLFQKENWLDQLSPLQNSEVLDALARLLGMSNFLWDDFLKLQHENLFPVVSNLQGLQLARPVEELQAELHQSLQNAPASQHPAILNSFKDREMMRVDMRHILGLQHRFGMFSQELGDVAEVVIQAALQLATEHIALKYGKPLKGDQTASSIALFGLGKCGGRELGFASDIELLFVYEGDGKTSGPKVIRTIDFYHKLIEYFQKLIHSKRKGVFEVDLRLRPYGNAGGLAVSLDLFNKYFSPEGDAWPYERQALVKLRPIAGDEVLGHRVVQLRDSFLYRGGMFDMASMRAMREKQNRQLVVAGSFNAKLSPGGLVDCEYLVQGLQITYGHLSTEIRNPNTRQAMKGLEEAGVISHEIRLRLRDAYRFFRRVIDGLRMVRGDASDLNVPAFNTKEFNFLARRLGYGKRVLEFQQEFERHTLNVLELNMLLEESITSPGF